MSTCFSSPEGARDYLLSICGLGPEVIEKIVEVPDLKVGGFDSLLLDDPSTSEEIKSEIIARMEAQKGFKVQTPKGELRFVIGPFRDGFECWVLGENGFAQRL